MSIAKVFFTWWTKPSILESWVSPLHPLIFSPSFYFIVTFFMICFVFLMPWLFFFFICSYLFVFYCFSFFTIFRKAEKPGQRWRQLLRITASKFRRQIRLLRFYFIFIYFLVAFILCFLTDHSFALCKVVILMNF